MKLRTRYPRLYRLLLWSTLAASLVLLWQLNLRVLSKPAYIPVDDFGHYWAAGKLNQHGSNPYSPEQVQAVRDQITGKAPAPDTIPIMWTPPWSLPLVMPFGALDYPLSRVLWLMVSVGLVLSCTNLLWKLYLGPPRWLWLAWLAAFIFGPTISVLEKGQITPWVLLGITGFLYAIEVKNNQWLAGICAALIAIKPQLFYLFWPIVLLWAFRQRHWKFLAGLAFTLAGAVFVSLLFNPAVISQYLQALTYDTPADWATPTLGGYLRLLFGAEHFWLQFAPLILGLGWAAYYVSKRWRTWHWAETIPVLLLASILTCPYGWTYDQVILLPAMLQAASWLVRQGRRPAAGWLVAAFVLIQGLDLFLHRSLDEFWFGWLAPALLLWYLAVRHCTQPIVEKDKQETAS